jgi:hypothetical protein
VSSAASEIAHEMSESEVIATAGFGYRIGRDIARTLDVGIEDRRGP